MAEFADHLKAKHSSGDNSERQTNDNQLLPVKQVFCDKNETFNVKRGLKILWQHISKPENNKN